MSQQSPKKSRAKPSGGPKSKKKKPKSVSDPIKALWRKGGPLNGFKSMPKLISKVNKDGTFEVKGFVRDDNKLEESMTLVLIHALDWPRSPSNDWKVDAYYPNYSFFAELHETQHVDPSDFRMKLGTKWADQKLADKRKLLHLVSQGFHGIIVLGFVGPFFDPDHIATPRWLKVGASETQKRSLLALRVVAQARVDLYRRNNYDGRVYVFSSAIGTADQEQTLLKLADLEKGDTTTMLSYNSFDPMDIGGRYLELREINEAARKAAQGFTVEHKSKLLAEAEAMLQKVKAYLAKKQPQAEEPAPADSDDGSEDDDEEEEEEQPATVSMNTTAPPAPIQGQLIYVTDTGQIVPVKNIKQLTALSLQDDPPFPQPPTGTQPVASVKPAPRPGMM